MIPDCRADGPYNEKNLDVRGSDMVLGYDTAVSEIISFFGNLDVYPEAEMILDPDVAVVNKDKSEILRKALNDWLEMQRNELIVSLIDDQNEMPSDGSSEGWS